ncbi:MAG: DNA topoisomerase 3 [Syntrophobacteraceae bacterium]
MISLILTEKPSVARDFATALQAGRRGDGFLQSKDTIITWAIGHLVELAHPDDYDPKWKRWRLETLPILPESLTYKPIQKVQKQLRVIQGLLKRGDVTRIIIATDAGREGEVIARTILQTVEPPSRREIYRFWTSQALTPAVIQETLRELKPSSEYDRLWHAGQARQVADWLVGMNLSRAATLKMGGHKDVYSVGRVQTAVLALLVDRRREREHFAPQTYWILVADFVNEKGDWQGTWFKGDKNRFETREDAEACRERILSQTGVVLSVKRDKRKQPPPFLYSLTDLQRDANARYGFSAQKTLDIAQRLYEQKKCLSYPRTDSKVLGSKNIALVKSITEKLAAAYPELFAGMDPRLLSPGNKRVFNDAKLTDHHALIPLKPLPPGADPGEKHVYDLVLRRFAAAFHPDYQFESTEIITEVLDETFRTKGSRPIVLGWRAVSGMKEKPKEKTRDRDEVENGSDNDEAESESLPRLEKGDPASVKEVASAEKVTQPPPEYSEATLLRDMTNPARFVSEAELQKIFKGDVGLGTQATRAQIIETLILRQYILRDKKRIAATDKGCLLIDRLRQYTTARAIASPKETARWEMELEQIAQGNGNPKTFLSEIRRFVEQSIRELKGQVAPYPSIPAGLGSCPKCGGAIIEGKRGYGCSNWRKELGGCTFVIWKQIAGKILPLDGVKRLLEQGETEVISGFLTETGEPYSAKLRLEGDQKETVIVKESEQARSVVQRLKEC